MKLLNFEIDKNLVFNNQAELADTIRVLFYKQNPLLFDKLAYDNDLAFLEPTLFYFFLAESKNLTTSTLEQSVFGYIEPSLRPKEFEARSDQFGFINLPNIGYLHSEPSQQVKIVWDFNSKELRIKDQISKLTTDSFINGTSIRLCKHHSFLISQLSLDGEMVRFNESADHTLTRHLNHIENAFVMMKKISPEFTELLINTVREISIMSSPNIYSMAAISYHGTAFINTEGLAHDEVFFIDDLAHQCGHVVFNALTLQTTEYLKVPKETFLREFISEKREGRTIYGAFHGLFTYTTILFFLDKALSGFQFDVKQRHEIIGRIGFYTKKFGSDLKSLDNDQIFTSEGLKFIKKFKDGYDYINDKYNDKLILMNFEGSPYVFSYDFFNQLNPISKFETI
ncbi:hypothetical protein SanaruYs_31110 [Chryseotalea sanaruensis]|uniref:HEXXH motif domain-containing protein n=1 Tax=Chryseotalea sanaruensis TaxID=2482724 RepID=A0A401UDF2_9BACT|nr:hypothetical protein [Chryseotalea sanaruensis]GCC52872.1 hypothetical protein SanaruYs_31110 [Chryseotalea sanaruensis]